MWELDYEERWVLKNWYFETVVLEKNLESPLDCKEIKPANPIGNQTWIFIRRNDAEVEAPIFWPPDVKSRLIGKKPLCWERLKARGEGGNRGRDDWMASPTQWTWVWANSGWWLKDKEAWHAAVYGIAKSQTWLRDWATTNTLHGQFAMEKEIKPDISFIKINSYIQKILKSKT